MRLSLSSICCVLAVLAGITLFWLSTDGLRALTAESARRLEVIQHPIHLPSMSLVSSTGQKFNLLDDSQLASNLILLEFFFSRCLTICQLMGADFSMWQTRIISDNIQPQVSLLSISFDPDDNQSGLASYANRYRAIDSTWRVAKPTQPNDLIGIKKLLNLIVIPDKHFGFIHNAAVYAVNNGKVIAILDHDDMSGIKKLIEAHLK